jgi:enamine deaminase RidA (YjgF/YER057c/UK114 family)
MEKRHINPPGIYKHPAFTRVISVKGPMKILFIAGQTASDENYRPVAKGDYRGQYIKVIEGLTAQLAAAGATWDDVVYKRIFVLDIDKYREASMDPSIPTPWSRDKPPGSTLIGVTRLSHPDFLIEIDLMAVTNE